MKPGKLGLIARGFAMGIAEIIPGVSGGTIAFISGIYKDLLDAVTGLNINALGKLLKADFKGFSSSIKLPFLIFLVIGMVIGIVSGVFGITFLLENYPEVIWALFFGLILASVPYMLLQMKTGKPLHILIFLAGALIAWYITTLTPVNGNTSLLYLFFGGTIAICALVLPGVSGSFMLLLLGLYSLVIPTLKSLLSNPGLESFKIIFVFGLGCIVGLLGFSRIVSRAFEKYHDGTIALLSGFMLGSLNKIWPWRNPELFFEKETGTVHEASSIEELVYQNPDAYKIMSEINVLPDAYSGEPRIFAVSLAILSGIIMVYALSRVQKEVY